MKLLTTKKLFLCFHIYPGWNGKTPQSPEGGAAGGGVVGESNGKQENTRSGSNNAKTDSE